MSATLQGTRVYAGKMNDLPVGGYGKFGGEWIVRMPTGELGNISGHTITEHEDGTITVSPSILDIMPGGGGYHGWLERGVWREA